MLRMYSSGSTVDENSSISISPLTWTVDRDPGESNVLVLLGGAKWAGVVALRQAISVAWLLMQAGWATASYWMCWAVRFLLPNSVSKTGTTELLQSKCWQWWQRWQWWQWCTAPPQHIASRPYLVCIWHLALPHKCDFEVEDSKLLVALARHD
jgi:hypothetical protein